jgi:hypothetical protein
VFWLAVGVGRSTTRAAEPSQKRARIGRPHSASEKHRKQLPDPRSAPQVSRMKAMKKLRKAARKLMKKVVRHVEEFVLACLHAAERLQGRTAPTAGRPSRALKHADERTWRRIAEAEHGGTSSAESAARWERGENPGGTHRRSVRPEGPTHPRPEQEEPQERKERELFGEKHMAASRRGG